MVVSCVTLILLVLNCNRPEGSKTRNMLYYTGGRLVKSLFPNFI